MRHKVEKYAIMSRQHNVYPNCPVKLKKHKTKEMITQTTKGIIFIQAVFITENTKATDKTEENEQALIDSEIMCKYCT